MQVVLGFSKRPQLTEAELNLPQNAASAAMIKAGGQKKVKKDRDIATYWLLYCANHTPHGYPVQTKETLDKVFEPVVLKLKKGNWQELYHYAIVGYIPSLNIWLIYKPLATVLFSKIIDIS